jgi:predicted DNA-binding transcriptional regulator YafY
MCSKHPKKLLIINILEILKKYSDENHRLSQKEIGNLLKTEYGMTADRKAIRRNLSDLMESGYPIEYSESIRMVPVKDKDGNEIMDSAGNPILEENTTLSDFYLERKFTDGELRLLIDGLLFSHNVPFYQCKQLVEKLENLSNVYFHSRVSHIAKVPIGYSDNKQLFLNIEMLDEAISTGRKIKCHYLEYGLDKRLHTRKRPDGTVREYVINPYQMAAQEGKYYLICNYDKYDNISNYRIDRIADIEILDDPVKPFSSLPWAKGSTLDLAAYMREHPYMYASENVHAKLQIVPAMLSDILDYFGKEVRLSQENNTIYVTLTASEMALAQFAKNFAPDVIVLEPKSLRDKVKEDLLKGLEGYQ